MAENAFRPPISAPPSRPPSAIQQVATDSTTMPWGAIPRVSPKPDKALGTLPIAAKRGAGG